LIRHSDGVGRLAFASGGEGCFACGSGVWSGGSGVLVFFVILFFFVVPVDFVVCDGSGGGGFSGCGWGSLRGVFVVLDEAGDEVGLFARVREGACAEEVFELGVFFFCVLGSQGV